MYDDVNVDALIKQINNNERTIEELTDEEKKAVYVRTLLDSKLTYKTNKHFGRSYKKERRKKNKSTRQMRRKNR